jgi:benzoyl-CoA reductase/2-hydroxyglutaryl-CoA dehydratase subunit BcrC/BadD/HgdB
VVAFSLYNPAHFWELLRSKGYTVVVDSRSRFVNATKKEGGRILQLGNMDYFRHLTSNFLMSDETVAKMLDKVTDELEKQKEGTRIKVDLNPRMKLRN